MKTLTKEQLKQMIDNKENFVLVNVLDKKYFDDAHIPGSISIPVSNDDFKHNLEKQIPDKSSKVVVYCASFECQASPGAVEKMTSIGYTDVYDYEGGIKDWKDAGFTTHKA